MPVSRLERKIIIGRIEEETLYVNFTLEPTPQLPRRISCFKIACTGETPVNDSLAVVFEGPDVSGIASEIATALIYIAEERLPPLTNTPVQGHPEIRVELENRNVRIANINNEPGILIPWDCVSRLGRVLENTGEPTE